MKKLGIVFLGILLFASSYAQNTPDSIQEYLQSAYESQRFQGTALIAQGGEIIYSGAIGDCQFDPDQPCQTTTRFPILSLTKTFTATLILAEMEKSNLSLDDPISNWFPDFPNGEKIQIKHLLTHSSGIFNYTDPVGVEDSLHTNYPKPKSEWYEFIKENTGAEGPFRYSVYNNSGFYLMGLVLEKINGKPYETLIRERIFKPLQMTHSGFDYLGLPDSISATGLQYWTDASRTEYAFYDSTYAYSAGSIYSTVDDLYQWGMALRNHKILSEKTWKAATKRQLTQFGYAWRLGKFSGHDYIRHPGGYPGFASDFLYYPKEDLLIILLSNYGNYGIGAWPVAMGLSSLMFGEPYDLWEKVVDMPLSDDQLQKLVGSYFFKKREAKISLEDGHLFLSLQGLPTYRLYAQSENIFHTKVFNTKLIFGGRELIIHEHGAETIWMKE